MERGFKNKPRSRIGALRIMTARVLIAVVFLTLFSFPDSLPVSFTGLLPGLFSGEMTVFAASNSQIAGGGDKTASGSQMENDGKGNGENDGTDDGKDGNNGKNDGTDDRNNGKNDGTDDRNNGQNDGTDDKDDKTDKIVGGSGAPDEQEVPLQARLLRATATPSDAWSGYRDEGWSGGEIRTAGELAQFAYLISQGDTFAGETVRLAKDINLRQHPWEPILGVFSGTFDGKGHSITGMNVEVGGDYNIIGGFFGIVMEAEIKNLKLSGNIKYHLDGSAVSIGGITAIAFNSAMRNCSTDIAIRPIVGEEEPDIMMLGSMSGASIGGRYENCTSEGSLTVHHIKGNKTDCVLNVGGLTGNASLCEFVKCTNMAEVNCALEYDESGRNVQLYGGGLTGKSFECNFTDCTNAADVRCEMEHSEHDIATMVLAGGIAGRTGIGSSVNRCANQGDLSTEGYNTVSGGIAAFMTDSTVINCVNTGSLRAEGKNEAVTAGICGTAYLTMPQEPIGRIANCANYGQASSRSDGGMVWSGGIGGSVGGLENEQIVLAIENCTSGGRLSGEGTGNGELAYRAVGGICGYGGPCEIRHCFWLGGTAEEPVTLDEGETPEEGTAVFDSAIYDRKNGSYLLREEVSGTYSLTKAMNLWAEEHSGEDGFDFDGWRLKEGKPAPIAGLEPAEALNSEQSRDSSAGNRGRSGFSPRWTRDEKGWRYQRSPVEYTAGGWENLYWDGAYHWYHFNAEGYLDTGWFTDTDGAVYYLHPLHDGKYGYMYTGPNLIDGKEYYFETEAGKGQGALRRN